MLVQLPLPHLPRARLLAENGKQRRRLSQGARLKRERGRGAGHQLLQSCGLVTAVCPDMRSHFQAPRGTMRVLKSLQPQKANEDSKKEDGKAKQLLLLLQDHTAFHR